MNTYNDLLKDIIETRDLAGWNDSELCKALGISQQLWSRIKNKKQRPTTGFLLAVARTFPHLTKKAVNYNNTGDSFNKE